MVEQAYVERANQTIVELPMNVYKRPYAADVERDKQSIIPLPIQLNL